MELIFEKSQPGRQATTILACDVPQKKVGIPSTLLRDDVPLPEIAEVDLMRHYTNLSRRNFGVDLGMYPLGSCTMKYNPKVNENAAKLAGFTDIHPYASEDWTQGNMRMMFELRQYLSEILGMADFTLQPAAGAHGELTGVMVMKKYFEKKGEKRTIMLVPDAAHGTNPASVALCGFEVVTVRSCAEGGVDIEHLRELMADNVVGLMLTNPNTVGLFERNIEQVISIVHAKGGLCYCDGANTNAFMGVNRPGDLGFDVIQLNLHKSFSTPHGCGGPGSGPVGVAKQLVDFLPYPRVIKTGDTFAFDYDCPDSIGRVKAFYGNFNVMVKAYAYIRSLGAAGLRRASENAVLNANYVMAKLKNDYQVAFDRICMHECVFTGDKQVRESGVHTADIAKRMIDYGYHPPTIYFPMIVSEALMIEPNETESLETLDAFCDVMIKIAGEAKTNPQLLHDAPLTTPVSRMDDVKAAREPNICWKC